MNLPKAKIDFVWTRTGDGSSLEAVNSGDAIHLMYSPEIPLGSTLKGARWNGKSIHARLQAHDQDAHATVDVDLPHGTSHISFEYSGGVSLILPQVKPLLGDGSRSMKVIDVKLNGSTYTVDAQVDSCASLKLQVANGSKGHRRSRCNEERDLARDV